MNLSKSLFICMFSTILFFTIVRTNPVAPVPPTGSPTAPAVPAGNEEQMLAQLDSVFEELTKGMSEPEKNQFFNELNSAMEEEIDKMSKMDDAELTKYIQDAEKELQSLGSLPEQESPQPVQPIQPTASVEPTKPIEPKVEQKKPTRDMVPAIDEIIARIESFIQKANQIVEMSVNFEKWGKKGKLRGWNPTITWAIFKEKLESLKKTLLSIKSLDPKTAKPKYLTDLAANASLCNNINQFKTVLAKHEPGVQAPSFGLKKLGKSSKAAFVAVINDCLEALLALNLQTELEKIIAKYEPTEKKIKEAEEKAQQAALKASSQQRIPGRMATTVRREEPGYYEFGAPTKPGYPGYPGHGPSYTPEKKAEFDEKGGNKAKDDKKPEGDKGAEAAKKEEKKGPESKKEDVRDTETTKKIENKCSDFEISIGEALENYANSTVRTKASSNNPDEIRALNSDIAALAVPISSASKAARDAQTLIATLDKNQTQQKDKYVKRFKAAWTENRSNFMHIADKLQAIPAVSTQPVPQEENLRKLHETKEQLKEKADDIIKTIKNIDQTISNIGAGTKKHYHF